MAATYPGAAKTFPARINGTPIEDAYVNEPGDEITAVENDLLSAWTTWTFSAAYFTSSAAGAWTVEAADVASVAYKKIGKTVHATFEINNSSVGAVATGNLYIALPGVTAARFGLGVVFIREGATVTYGFVDVISPGDNRLRIFKHNLGAFVANSVNNLSVRGSITFEAQ